MKTFEAKTALVVGGTSGIGYATTQALVDAGAKLYMCGQSMHARGVPKEKIAEPIQTALSAMTVILSLQNEGYQLIKF